MHFMNQDLVIILYVANDTAPAGTPTGILLSIASYNTCTIYSNTTGRVHSYGFGKKQIFYTYFISC